MRLLIRIFLAAALAVASHAQQPTPPPPAKPAEAKPAEAKPEEKKKEGEAAKKSETKHSIAIGGKKIDYTATAGTIELKDEQDKATASIFFIAYTKDGKSEAAKRPLTFSFNGGPGSSSVWLHMGLLGPRRVRLADDGSALPPPYSLVDNEWSLLDETDLVFIDPVSTGFSRAAKPEDTKKFHGVQGDVSSVAEFIRLYVTKNERWASPKFIIGESYGTTRAAALSGELANRHRMNVNGIMLVSAVLNFQTIRFADGNDLPYVLFFPSYTATAWQHKKLPPDLQQLDLKTVLAQSEAFAQGEFSQALFQGAALPADKRKAAVQQTARLTGLSAKFVERANLRISLPQFAAELLRAEGKVVGRFDGRYTGLIRDPLAPFAEHDPSSTAIMSAYASTFNHYIRTELKYEEDRAYEILGNVGRWEWNAENGYLNVAETLAASITENPFLKVHVSNGIFDLATPYFASRYTFNHMQLPRKLQKNIIQDDYTAGHMMYLNLPDLKKQKADLAKFIRGSVAK